MKRMLFNATHAEETRVAIVDGQKLVDIDIEVAGHESRKSNIYKGIITRIEPSLEACFVDYGDVKHGFLSFKEVGRQYFKDGLAPSSAKIQEALHVGQELLVQMEKEERGNKGAALTSFISLAGRYMVLMPNNPRGGGVSRRIDGEDRSELRAMMDQLQVPAGMGVIARTAAIDRTLEELQWDLNYLLQLWKAIDGASETKGAFLIYQESSLIIRAIRDYFSADVKQILIDTDDVYEQAKQFVGYVMPDMAERVVRYNEDVPLFTRFQIEHQIETAHSRQVPLPSGGSIVIDHTEALVAIDVNSARSTRGGDIEETATRTNLEAAEEAARQLRLRDLGGLVVIDFIDMEDSKNQRAVEAKLKEGLRHDRARLQMGKISRFGLMELSRQRMRPSLAEGSHTACPRCNGTGSIRDVNSTALHILRLVQEEAMKDGTAALHVQVPVDVATFLLNEKRLDLAKLETKLNVSVVLIPNRHIETPNYKLERLKHEDTRLDNPKPTYELADEAEDLDLSKNKSQAKAPQVAKVTGITPPERAPLVERSERVERTGRDSRSGHDRRAAPATAKTSLWSKIKTFFGASSEETSLRAENEAKLKADGERKASGGRGDRNERGDRTDRGDRGGRGRDRNGRGGERSGTERGERAPRTERPPRDADAPRTERPPREPRADRGERSPRPPRNEQRTETLNVQTPANEASVNVAVTTTANSAPEIKVIREGREGRAERNQERGERRGHGGRYGKAGQTDANPEAVGNELTPASLAAVANAQAAAQPPLVLEVPGFVAGAAPADTDRPERTERSGRGGRSRGRGGRGGEGRADRGDASTDNAEQVAPTVANTSDMNSVSVVATPALAPAPSIAPIAEATPLAETALRIEAAPMNLAPLQQVSQAVGLEWVNTDAQAFAKAQARIAAQAQKAHVPRERRPRSTVVEEPLQLVETAPK